MNLTKQQELKQHYTPKKRKVLPVKVITEAIKFIGAGFYVGFMEGSGTPIDPITKYTLLTIPSVLSGAFSAASCYGMQELMKFTFEDDSSNLEQTLSGVYDNKKEGVQETINKIDYTNPTPKMSRLVAKSAGKIALKTGIGYIAGYGLAKLL